MAQKRTAMRQADEAPVADTIQVGCMVKHWRKKRGYTLAELAERARMNPGFLCQIENDKASPSLQTLAAIAAALEIPITYLLLQTCPQMEVIRSHERLLLSEDELRVELISTRRNRDIRMLLVTMPPGIETEEHAHPREEHHLVLKGKLRITQGEQRTEVEAGDYFYWDGSIPHNVENIGKGDAAILIAVTPPLPEELI